VIAVALVGAFLIWLLFIRGGDDESNAPNSPQKTVKVVSADGLLGAIAGVGYPVYWVGPKPGVQYEVTRIADGRTYVRYLPTGTKAGTSEPFLTVGSYFIRDAYGVTDRQARLSGGSFRLPRGGIALPNGPNPRSVYVAYPGIDVQIELYDPAAGSALQFVKSHALTPIG
jgi:hypothetical protein